MAITKVQKVVKGALEGKAFDMEGAISEDIKKGTYTAGSTLEARGVRSGNVVEEALGKIFQRLSK